MKHRHIFVPPFWKYNRFCLFCGRLESLTVGKNTVQLTDDKISFGAATTLNAAKQLGFDASSGLVYHDGISVKTVANTYELGTGSSVKIASLLSTPDLIGSSTAFIFNIPFTPDFITYPNGYWVSITPLTHLHLFRVTNDKNDLGAVAGQLILRHNLTDSIYGDLKMHFSSVRMKYVYIIQYTMRLVKDLSNYYLYVRCFGKYTTVTSSYIVQNSSTFGYVSGCSTVVSPSIPTMIKLTAFWEIPHSSLSADFQTWQVILYGLK